MDILLSNGILLATTSVAVSEPVSNEVVVVDDGAVNGGDIAVGGEGMITGEEMAVDAMGTGVKDPLLSSWPFVIGISGVVLAVSVVLGVLLAKRKIKKGIELYED